MMMQLELFPQLEALEDRRFLVDYWRRSLREWLKKVWRFRHYRDTTGWSMACGGFLFAKLLFLDGKMTRKEFRRWWRFSRRVRRWDEREG
jgi:hypothetical protein